MPAGRPPIPIAPTLLAKVSRGELTPAAAARLAGCSDVTVRQRIREAGAEPPRASRGRPAKPSTQRMRLQARRLRDRGLTAIQIAEQLGCSRQWVYQMLAG